MAAALGWWVADHRSAGVALELPQSARPTYVESAAQADKAAGAARTEERGRQTRIKIEAAIAALEAEGVSRDDLKEYFWDEIAEQLQDGPEDGTDSHGSAEDPDQARR
ncbi:hypothetical protein [uncultured Enterovirga sp.]|uniref:hypothetical protein n=1 Tax=uncultured Enterovirga sp. TaxID=2026352 RepID=UPI0035CA0A64